VGPVLSAHETVFNFPHHDITTSTPQQQPTSKSSSQSLNKISRRLEIPGLGDMCIQGRYLVSNRIPVSPLAPAHVNIRSLIFATVILAVRFPIHLVLLGTCMSAVTHLRAAMQNSEWLGWRGNPPRALLNRAVCACWCVRPGSEIRSGKRLKDVDQGWVE
jgi:hypothetical protein